MNKGKISFKILCGFVVFMLLFFLFTGCIENNASNDDEETNPNLLIYYSSSSNENETFIMKIFTDGEMIKNDTMSPNPGDSLYNIKGDEGEYHIKVEWDNKTSELDFRPNGQNSVSVVIDENNIELQEISD